MIKKIKQRLRRKDRVRFAIKSKLKNRNRIVVNKTNKHISVQLIDDVMHCTLASATTKGEFFAEKYAKLNKSSKSAAKILAEIFVQKINKNEISKDVVFDRGYHKYCGVIKEFADSLRMLGLYF